MSEGAWVLVVALVLAAAFGLYRGARDGRFRGTHPVRGAVTPTSSARDLAADSTAAEEGGSSTPTPSAGVLDGAGVDHPLGERATLLQFSSAFCAPCRATRRVLADVAEVVPGVTHIEVDAEHHLDLVRRLNILRTPTTLILDRHGREVSRATGAPRKEAVLATLANALA